MALLASLPMYDLEPLRPATDAWWSGVAAGLLRARSSTKRASACSSFWARASSIRARLTSWKS